MYARVGSARLDVKFVMDDLALRSDGVAAEQMCDEVIALIDFAANQRRDDARCEKQG